jgi:hypothetical protein
MIVGVKYANAASWAMVSKRKSGIMKSLQYTGTTRPEKLASDVSINTTYRKLT